MRSIFFFITLLLTHGTYGQCDMCEKALQHDIRYMDYKEKSDEHLLQLVDISNFDERKQEASQNRHYEAVYKVYSGIMKESKNYEEFQQKRNTYFSKTNFSSTREKSLEFFSNTMNEKGYHSYDNCINLCLRKSGLYLTVENETECELSFSLKYIAPETDPNAMLVIDTGSMSIINGSALSSTAKKLMREKTTLINGSKIDFIVEKKDNKKALFIEVNGKINSFFIPASLKIAPKFDFERLEEVKTTNLVLHTDSNCTTQKCLGIESKWDTEIVKIEYLGFLVAGRISDHPDGGPCREDEFYADQNNGSFKTLQFGHWVNPDCRTSVNDHIMGNGWHCSRGSCCRGGSQLGKVLRVDVKLTYKEFTYKKVPWSCH